MTDTYRIANKNNTHDARWTVLHQTGRIGISTPVTVSHDLTDLGAAVHASLIRAATAGVEVDVDLRPEHPLNVASHLTVLTITADTYPQDLPSQTKVESLLRKCFTTGRELRWSTITLSLTVTRGPQVSDSSDLVALFALRDVRDPVMSSGRKSSRPPAGVLRPDPPPDAHMIRATDPRFAELIEPFADVRELVNNAGPDQWDRVNQTLTDIESFRSSYSDATLEDLAASVLILALGKYGPKYLDGVSRRYGLHGGDLDTLDQVGRLVGVTRERVRQIQSKVVLPVEPIWAPAADTTMDLLAHVLPCTADQLTSAMVAAGATRLASWNAVALKSALALTGRTVDLQQTDELIGLRGQLEASATILSMARKLSDASGTGDVDEVSDRVVVQARPTQDPSDPAAGQFSVDLGTVRMVLESSDRLHWISADRFWVDHNPGRNRLVNTSLRILAVIQPQTTVSMHEGVDRHFRWRASTGGPRLAGLRVPIIEDLVSFYRSHPDFDLDDRDMVTATRPLDLGVLGPESLTMINILLSQPDGLASRNEFMAMCEQQGVITSTASVLLTYSELISHYGPNVWGLRGLEVDRDAVERTLHGARLARSQLDRRRLHGLTPSGRPWVAFKVTPAFRYSGVLLHPWGVSALTGAALEIIDMSDGTTLGTLGFSGPFTYGFSAAIRRLRIGVGAVIRVLADPTQDTSLSALVKTSRLLIRDGPSAEGGSHRRLSRVSWKLRWRSPA